MGFGEPMAAIIEGGSETVPARQDATAKFSADAAPVTPWSIPADPRLGSPSRPASAEEISERLAPVSSAKGRGPWPSMNTGTRASVWRVGRGEVATTSIFTACSPFGVPLVLSLERCVPTRARRVRNLAPA